MELLAALPPQQLQVVYIPVGGGGLISGRSCQTLEVTDVRVVGCYGFKVSKSGF